VNAFTVFRLLISIRRVKTVFGFTFLPSFFLSFMLISIGSIIFVYCVIALKDTRCRRGNRNEGREYFHYDMCSIGSNWKFLMRFMFRLFASLICGIKSFYRVISLLETFLLLFLIFLGIHSDFSFHNLFIYVAFFKKQNKITKQPDAITWLRSWKRVQLIPIYFIFVSLSLCCLSVQKNSRITI
jgi:hypothetical protein